MIDLSVDANLSTRLVLIVEIELFCLSVEISAVSVELGCILHFHICIN